MMKQCTSNREGGFSLIELLLVLTIIGIVSAIAIPMYMGQRQKARRIGDAEANARIMAMMLETRKAESATYGPVATYSWTASGGLPSSNIIPAFAVKGSSQMDYSLEVKDNGLTYVLTVSEKGGSKVFQTDQTGAKLYP
ncbi:MAG: type II secretion system protein [Acidobacteria bacterium]|nr:type II secretion system protein [Acidobacteriota bacterium]